MKLPIRIHAGNNGVYDAVEFARGEWFIRYRPNGVDASVTLETLIAMTEFSVDSYDSAHEAMLAFERGPISYRANEVVA